MTKRREVTVFDFDTTITPKRWTPSSCWMVDNHILKVSAYPVCDGQNVRFIVTLLTPLPTKRGILCVEYDGYFVVELKYPFTLKHPDKIRMRITEAIRKFALKEVKRVMREIAPPNGVVFLPSDDGISILYDVEDLPFLSELKKNTFYIYAKINKGTAYRYLGGNENFHINFRLNIFSKREFKRINPYHFTYEFCKKVVTKLNEVWKWLSVPENVASLYSPPSEVEYLRVIPFFRSAEDKHGPRYCGFIYHRGRKTTLTLPVYYDFSVKREVWDGFLYPYLVVVENDVRGLASRLMFAYATRCTVPERDEEIGEYLRILSLIAEM